MDYVIILPDGATLDIQRRPPLIPPADTSVNVALASAGAVASASSTYSGPPVHGVGAINNGSRTGAPISGVMGIWASAPTALPAVVQINFNGVKSVDKVIVYSCQDNYLAPVEPSDTLAFTLYGHKDFTITVWNGTVWQTVANITNNTLVKRTCLFPAVVCNAVRVDIPNSRDQFARLAEVEVFGQPSTTVLPSPPALTGPVIVVPPTGAPLAALLSTMAVGSWALMNPAPINMASALIDPSNPGSGSGNIVPFASHTPYDSFDDCVWINGATHGSTSPKLVRYLVPTNTFEVVVNPDFASHPFGLLTIDPATGTLWKYWPSGPTVRPTGLYYRLRGGSAWIQAPLDPSIFVTNGASYHTLVWWLGKPVFCEGVTGGIWDCSGVTPVKIGEHPTARNVYHNVAVVTPKGLVFGGGNGSSGTWREDHGKEIYLLDAPNGTRTRLADAPYPVGISNGMQICGDSTGKVIAMGGGDYGGSNKRETWLLDPAVSGPWVQKAGLISTGPLVGWDDQFSATHAYDAANFQDFPNDVICAEIPRLKCVVTFQYREGHGPARMYVYKSA